MKAKRIISAAAAILCAASAHATVFEFGSVSGNLTLLTDPARSTFTDVTGVFGEAGRQLRMGNVSATLRSPGGAQDRGTFNDATGELEFTMGWDYSFAVSDPVTDQIVGGAHGGQLMHEVGLFSGDSGGVSAMNGEGTDWPGGSTSAARGVTIYEGPDLPAWYEWLTGAQTRIIIIKIRVSDGRAFEPGEETRLSYDGSQPSGQYEMALQWGPAFGNSAVYATAFGSFDVMVTPTPGAAALTAISILTLARRRR